MGFSLFSIAAFDTQTCKQLIEVTGANSKYVCLEPEPKAAIQYIGLQSSVEYEILHLQFNKHKVHGLDMSLTFRRRLEYHVSNTFVQVRFHPLAATLKGK